MRSSAARKTWNLLNKFWSDSATCFRGYLTFFVVYLAHARGFISKEEAKGILDASIVNGFYVSTEVYSKFVNLLNPVKLT